jgi:hypothetical protein
MSGKRAKAQRRQQGISIAARRAEQEFARVVRSAQFERAMAHAVGREVRAIRRRRVLKMLVGFAVAFALIVGLAWVLR